MGALNILSCKIQQVYAHSQTVQTWIRGAPTEPSDLDLNCLKIQYGFSTMGYQVERVNIHINNTNLY